MASFLIGIYCFRANNIVSPKASNNVPAIVIMTVLIFVLSNIHDLGSIETNRHGSRSMSSIIIENFEPFTIYSACTFSSDVIRALINALLSSRLRLSSWYKGSFFSLIIANEPYSFIYFWLNKPSNELLSITNTAYPVGSRLNIGIGLKHIRICWYGKK